MRYMVQLHLVDGGGMKHQEKKNCLVFVAL